MAVAGPMRARVDASGTFRVKLRRGGGGTHGGLGTRRVFVGHRWASPRATRGFLNYLVREGVGEDGREGRLFSQDAHMPSTRVFIGDAELDPTQWWLLFSPEYRDELNLQVFTREIMALAQKDLSQPLDWRGAEHHNTAAPHTHVLLRGRDQEGHTLKIDAAYMRDGLKARAEQVLTQMLGIPDMTLPHALLALETWRAHTKHERSLDQELGHEMQRERDGGREWER